MPQNIACWFNSLLSLFMKKPTSTAVETSYCIYEIRTVIATCQQQKWKLLHCFDEGDFETCKISIGSPNKVFFTHYVNALHNVHIGPVLPALAMETCQIQLSLVVLAMNKTYRLNIFKDTRKLLPGVFENTPCSYESEWLVRRRARIFPPLLDLGFDWSACNMWLIVSASKQ